MGKFSGWGRAWRGGQRRGVGGLQKERGSGRLRALEGRDARSGVYIWDRTGLCNPKGADNADFLSSGIPSSNSVAWGSGVLLSPTASLQ